MTDKTETTTYPYLDDIASDLAHEISRAVITNEENIKTLLIKFADEVRRSAIEP